MRPCSTTQVGADTLRRLLDELVRRLGRPRRRAGAAGQRLAFPEPARDARVPRPAAPREAAEVLARRDGDAGHRGLPPAGDARRHRGHPRRHRQRPDRQAARGTRLDRGHRLPRGTRPAGAVRDDAPVPRRPGSGQPGPAAAAGRSAGRHAADARPGGAGRRGAAAGRGAGRLAAATAPRRPMPTRPMRPRGARRLASRPSRDSPTDTDVRPSLRSTPFPHRRPA